MQLRPYQQDLKDRTYAAWQQGHRNVLAVAPTGSGKTVIMASILHDHVGPAMAIAHRQELVSQISMALSREGIVHNVIAQTKLIKWLISEQIRETGQSWYNCSSQVTVAGVDTLIRRHAALKQYLNKVTLWITDEAHHISNNNKWYKACEMMPNARGLGVTATPCRADGAGLGRHVDGLADVMIEGPTMRSLIDDKFLTEYRIFAPPSDLDLGQVTVSDKTGEFVAPQLKKAVQESHLVGDVVDHYKRIAMGKLGVTFATDVETATEIAAKFNASGVPAEVVSAKTPDSIRTAVLAQFKARKVMQLVNVDLFGEGFDLPAIEVVSMARPTQSYALYVQQFGRALRPMEGNPGKVAIIIDHAGNVVRHGLPDRERIWTLERSKKPASVNPDDDIPLRYCVECTQPYERFLTECPYCGHVPVPEERSTPEQVDGDLTELSPEVLAQMREAVASADEAPELARDRMMYAGAPRPAWMGAMKRIRTRQDAQVALRESMAWWAGYQRSYGRSDRESYRIFYHTFGIDVMSAQALGQPDTIALATRINTRLGAMACQANG